MNRAEIPNPMLVSAFQHEGLSRDFVAAIDFGGSKIDVATANLNGLLLKHYRLKTDASGGAEQAVERALAATRTLIARSRDTSGGRCLAVGAVSPGVILPDRVLLAPNVPGWEQLALLDTVREKLGIERIAVENDVKAAAMAEVLWGNLQDADPAVFLNLGTGVAAAIVVNGQVLRGAHGASGEIGYNLRTVVDEIGVAHGHAPLEEAVGGRAISERGNRLLDAHLNTAEIFAHPDARVRSLIDEALAELAVHVANLTILIDPARVVVGGGLMGSREPILRALISRIRFAVPFPPEVVSARFVHDAPLRGAIALALRTLAARRAGTASVEERDHHHTDYSV